METNSHHHTTASLSFSSLRNCIIYAPSFSNLVLKRKIHVFGNIYTRIYLPSSKQHVQLLYIVHSINCQWYNLWQSTFLAQHIEKACIKYKFQCLVYKWKVSTLVSHMSPKSTEHAKFGHITTSIKAKQMNHSHTSRWNTLTRIYKRSCCNKLTNNNLLSVKRLKSTSDCLIYQTQPQIK